MQNYPSHIPDGRKSFAFFRRHRIAGSYLNWQIFFRISGNTRKKTRTKSMIRINSRDDFLGEKIVASGKKPVIHNNPIVASYSRCLVQCAIVFCSTRVLCSLSVYFVSHNRLSFVKTIRSSCLPKPRRIHRRAKSLLVHTYSDSNAFIIICSLEWNFTLERII